MVGLWCSLGAWGLGSVPLPPLSLPSLTGVHAPHVGTYFTTRSHATDPTPIIAHFLHAYGLSCSPLPSPTPVMFARHGNDSGLAIQSVATAFTNAQHHDSCGIGSKLRQPLQPSSRLQVHSTRHWYRLVTKLQAASTTHATTNSSDNRGPDSQFLSRLLSRRRTRHDPFADDTSELPGKSPGPPRSESSTEAIRASRRASCHSCLDPFAEAIRGSRRARRRARLASSHPPKRYEQAAGQAATPVSIHAPKRYEQAAGQAATPVSIHSPKRYDRAVEQAASPVSILSP